MSDIAVLFDVDGTLVDSERDGHRVAFNEAFEAFGLPFRWSVEEYGSLLHITGGRHRLAAYLAARGTPDPELAARVHAHKTELFVGLVGSLAPRPGIAELISALHQLGVGLHVVTTGRREWVDPLLDRCFGPVFEVVITGDDVTELKPDPAAYLLAKSRISATALVAVEDSHPGVTAAVAAGLPVVALRNGYTRDHDLSAAAVVLDDSGLVTTDAVLSVAGAGVVLQ